jgi:hypothetical protein
MRRGLRLGRGGTKQRQDAQPQDCNNRAQWQGQTRQGARHAVPEPLQQGHTLSVSGAEDRPFAPALYGTRPAPSRTPLGEWPKGRMDKARGISLRLSHALQTGLSALPPLRQPWRWRAHLHRRASRRAGSRAAAPARAAVTTPPRLVIALAMDQFSADLFAEYRSHFTGGLARLASGAVFPAGYQSHAATETCPGHSRC